MAYFDGVQIGDKVVCLLYGEGTVTEVASKYCLYLITAKFSDETTINYTIGGMITTDGTNQCLFYAGTQINIIPTTEPKREIKLVCPLCGEPVHISKYKCDKWINICCNNNKCLKPATGWMEKEKAIAKWLAYSWETTGNER